MERSYFQLQVDASRKLAARLRSRDDGGGGDGGGDDESDESDGSAAQIQAMFETFQTFQSCHSMECAQHPRSGVYRDGAQAPGYPRNSPTNVCYAENRVGRSEA